MRRRGLSQRAWGVLGLLAAACMARSPAAWAKALSPEAYLRKLSLQLQGVPPDVSELDALEEAERNHREGDFFEAKIKEYLSSELHADKLSYRLEELFRLETSKSGSRLVRSGTGEVPYYQNANSLNHLFHRIARENLPWDELLKGKDYRLFADTMREADHGKIVPAASDLDFLSPLLDDPARPLPRDAKFAPDDARVAGAITTARFFERYPTTAVNKNRKRAAAVFAIFLCDAMQPVIPAPSADEGELMGLAFPDPRSGGGAAQSHAGDIHGSRPDCNACHYKLDPLGLTFLASPNGLNPVNSPGALVYTNRKGKLVNIPVKGLGELGQVISERPEYESCQVRHFWDWYIGKDRPLFPAREKELVDKFNELGRRTDDFISYLVSAPEFRDPRERSPTELRADRVKILLGNCVGCHKPPIPDFTAWPMGGSKSSMTSWISKISRDLDLAHAGQGRKMPPQASPWQPASADLVFLQKWIDDGYPDEEGNPQR